MRLAAIPVLLLVMVGSLLDAPSLIGSSKATPDNAVPSCALEKLPGIPINNRPGRPLVFQPFDTQNLEPAQIPTSTLPFVSADSPCVAVPIVNDRYPPWSSSYYGPGHGRDCA